MQGQSEAHIKLPGGSWVSEGYEVLTRLKSQNMAPNQLGVRCLRRGSLTSLPSDMMCKRGWAVAQIWNTWRTKESQELNVEPLMVTSSPSVPSTSGNTGTLVRNCSP